MKEIRPAIAIYLENEEGEILLQRRKDQNKWGLLSGKIEFGETVEQAALREICEETGRDCSIERLIGIYSDPQTQTYQQDGKTIQFVTIYLKGKFTDNKAVKINRESLEMKYFAQHEIPDDLIVMSEFWLTDATDPIPTVKLR